MLRSLRARLLAWCAIVLLVVQATFAAVAVWSVWRSSLADLDARLGSMASRLSRSVISDASGGYEINLAEDDFVAFGAAGDPPYYVIWARDGSLIDRSDPLLDVASPGAPQARSRDGHREVIVRGEQGALVLVGQSLGEARQGLWTVIAGLAAAAGAALLLASLGAWLLVGRALAPIGRIARTAEAMSEANLGLRIAGERTDDELGRVVAALNRAFDRLQEAFERQTRFTADASHELRTPLTVQMAELEWALSRPRSSEDYERSLQVCMTAAQRMRAVVEGLLTLARADADPTPLRREPVDLASLAHEAAQSLRESAAERGITLRVDGAAATIAGDPDRLRELILNLLANAVQYNASGGHVICSTRDSENDVRLEVVDDGPGIEPEDVPHVFERFYRANKARSRVAGGAGLGLSISRWIVESHGGKIYCESVVGKGTRFIVEFPNARDENSPPESVGSVAVAYRTGRSSATSRQAS
jgi:heavy metal sensor kinase